MSEGLRRGGGGWTRGRGGGEEGRGRGGRRDAGDGGEERKGGGRGEEEEGMEERGEETQGMEGRTEETRGMEGGRELIQTVNIQQLVQQGVFCVSDLQDATALDAQRVLVDGDGQLIAEHGAGICLQGAQVVRHDERGRHDGPHSHLSTGLVNAETKVPNDQLGSKSKTVISLTALQ